MFVRVSELCFYGGSLRNPGDVIEVPDGYVCRYFHPIEPSSAPQPTQEDEPEIIIAGKRGRRVKTFKDETLP